MEEKREDGWGTLWKMLSFTVFYLIPCYYIRSIKSPLMHTSIWTASPALSLSLAHSQLWRKDKEKRFIFLSWPLNDIIKMTDSFEQHWKFTPVKTNLIRFGNSAWWFVRGEVQHGCVHVCAKQGEVGGQLLMRETLGGGGSHWGYGEYSCRQAGAPPPPPSQTPSPSFLTSILHPIPSVPHSFPLP